MNRNKIYYLIVLMGIIMLSVAVTAYWVIYSPNTITENNAKVSLFIPDSANFNDVLELFKSEHLLKNENNFIFVARQKKYPLNIKGGKYLIENGMSNNELINILRSGNQKAIQLTINNIRTKEELAGKLGNVLALDSIVILKQLNDRKFLKELNLNPETAIGIFIPNTYEIYWNISSRKLIYKMYHNYEKFWNSTRLKDAQNIALKPMEVITLASIVEEESNLTEEKPIIAGLYINRLKKGMPLQADPTLRFSLNNFAIKRILNEYKLIDSPYNTYKNKGLPPGPIRIPSIEGIEAVLHYTKHDYIFMCAKADFSGRHAFAKNLSEHLKNANLFQQELNRRAIFK